MFYCNDSLITELRNLYANHPDPKLNSKNGIFGLDAWVAKYYSNKDVKISDKNVVVQKPKYSKTSGIRQYSDDGRVVGYNNDIDLNRAYINYPQLLYNCGLNNLNELSDELTLKLEN